MCQPVSPSSQRCHRCRASGVIGVLSTVSSTLRPRAVRMNSARCLCGSRSLPGLKLILLTMSRGRGVIDVVSSTLISRCHRSCVIEVEDRTMSAFPAVLAVLYGSPSNRSIGLFDGTSEIPSETAIFITGWPLIRTLSGHFPSVLEIPVLYMRGYCQHYGEVQEAPLASIRRPSAGGVQSPLFSAGFGLEMSQT